MLAEFRWIIPGKLAGSARPGLLRSLEDDLEFLERVEIGLIVTLTEAPPPASSRTNSLHWMHFPIPDMGAPTPRAADQLVRQVRQSIDQARPVLVHCHAGMGRTGMILACVLVSLGSSPSDAIIEVRKRHHGYIQSHVQERFIEHYHQHISKEEVDLRGSQASAEARCAHEESAG